ncbi:MAG: hypothetical protein OEV40_02310 [Acidimicrobiia bacterium]|nr:hypothetical protein [Acidimicrobiia bacterium]
MFRPRRSVGVLSSVPNEDDDRPEPDRSSPLTWLGLAVALGAAGSVVALGFVAVVDAGQGLLWPDPLDPNAFSGSIRILIALTVGGLIVGALHALVPSAQEENVFVALASGRIDASAAPGGVAIAAVTLIAGFSLGPEVPTGMAAAGIAAFAVSRRLVRQPHPDVAMSAAILALGAGSSRHR